MDEARARELLAQARERMEQELARLRERLEGEELAHVDQHPADVGTETLELERDEGLAETLRKQLAEIERAERRLEKGAYGISVESGQPIPDERLELIPWAERTAEEQDRWERGL